jgi:hypothetical protein
MSTSSDEQHGETIVAGPETHPARVDLGTGISPFKRPDRQSVKRRPDDRCGARSATADGQQRDSSLFRQSPLQGGGTIFLAGRERFCAMISDRASYAAPTEQQEASR